MSHDHPQSDNGYPPALVRAACGGDEAAFGELFRALYPRMHRTVWGMLGSESEAHEVAQDAWVKAWQKRDKFNFDSQYGTWVHRIAVNCALDALRKRKKLRERFLPFLKKGDEGPGTRDQGQFGSYEEASPIAHAENRELGELIESEVANLPDEQRTVLVLREYEGYSYEEIAISLGVKQGTVMSRLYHARKKLQIRLAKEMS